MYLYYMVINNDRCVHRTKRKLLSTNFMEEWEIDSCRKPFLSVKRIPESGELDLSSAFLSFVFKTISSFYLIVEPPSIRRISGHMSEVDGNLHDPEEKKIPSGNESHINTKLKCYL